MRQNTPSSRARDRNKMRSSDTTSTGPYSQGACPSRARRAVDPGQTRSSAGPSTPPQRRRICMSARVSRLPHPLIPKLRLWRRCGLLRSTASAAWLGWVGAKPGIRAPGESTRPPSWLAVAGPGSDLGSPHAGAGDQPAAVFGEE
jgi:hypothetical protein